MFTLLSCSASEPVKVTELWPNRAPGEKGNIGEERDTTKPIDQLITGKPVIRLSNVSKPTMNNVPVELHVYLTGGHGYSLRSSQELVITCPQRAADCMRSRGLLQKE